MSFADNKEHEKYLARLFGGRVRKASGATWTQKGDVMTGKFLIEAKLRGGSGMTVSREKFEKIEREAVKEGKIPLIVVAFKELSETDQFVVVRLPYFMRILEGENGKEN